MPKYSVAYLPKYSVGSPTILTFKDQFVSLKRLWHVLRWRRLAMALVSGARPNRTCVFEFGCTANLHGAFTLSRSKLGSANLNVQWQSYLVRSSHTMFCTTEVLQPTSTLKAGWKPDSQPEPLVCRNLAAATLDHQP